MNKIHLIGLLGTFFFLFNACQSIEQISIDYMLPGEISFPKELKKVAIVNNTSSTPDNRTISTASKQKENATEEGTAYFNGNAKIATESLAKEIANQNYFDEVVICDSALRSKDILTRENTLSQEEVNLLSKNLQVDFIISLEDLQLKASKKVQAIDMNLFLAAIDVKVFPTFKIYLPNRKGVMATLHPIDSIYWDQLGISPEKAIIGLVPEKEMIKEASEFAGTLPLKQILPYWMNAKRYYYGRGLPDMRDAAIYIKENSWDKAYGIWKSIYDSKNSNKRKMKAAFNIALYYEIKDNIEEAIKWITISKDLAQKIDKVNLEKDIQFNGRDVPNYYITSMYLTELLNRRDSLMKLKMQMNRFENDF